MVIQVSAKIAAMVQERVASGQYAGPDDVLGEAMKLLEKRDQLNALRASIAEADAAIDRGEGIRWTPTLMSEIRQESKELARKGHKPNPDVCP